MIISAEIECKWCGAKISIPKKKTTRSFSIALNKLKRIHDWECEPKGKTQESLNISKSVTDDAIKKMLANIQD